jgi:polyketide biosynthesis enoyl-CoA hydratase PksH
MSRPYRTLDVRMEPPVCRVRLDRPEADNAIDAVLVQECRAAIESAARDCHVLVIEGSPDVFCTGADFAASVASAADPQALYALWEMLARGPAISIAHVRGRAAAGGVGFAAACDLVLADEHAQFALPELLFGLFPACVMPFLARRIGIARANALAVLTSPIDARQALAWGLADACEADSEALLRRHLVRLRRLSAPAVARYKAYAAGLDDLLVRAREEAVCANRALFGDPDVIAAIERYAASKRFPWEA